MVKDGGAVCEAIKAATGAPPLHHPTLLGGLMPPVSSPERAAGLSRPRSLSSPTLISAREPTYVEKRVAQLMAEAEARGAPFDAAGIAAAARQSARAKRGKRPDPRRE